MNRYLKYGLAVLTVFIIGFSVYYFLERQNNPIENSHQEEIYTCPMHPEIIKHQPGNCPICGMALVKKVTNNHDETDSSIDNLLKPANSFIVGEFQTATAKDTTISIKLNLPGQVTFDPNSTVNISARISGRIEKMYINYKYQNVKKGQLLFDLYSPELLTEQQNFVYLVTHDAENESIIKASKQKLLLYGMTNNQIKSLMATKTTNPTISIYSPASGIIIGTEKMDAKSPAAMTISNSTEALDVKEGNYIKKGEVVFKLMNTEKVWGIFNVLQGYSDLIKINQPMAITTEFDESNSINAKINFIETQLNPTEKTNRVRVYLDNRTLKLPIGLRLKGVINTSPKKTLWLQKQSMVSIGSKKIVFVKKGNGFEATAIKTGIETDDFVQIIGGISVKDTLAKNAQYLIDSESFIKTE
ncbi:MAG: efflux RND transporter periplasmic adaptor subunit [Flavobacterium sp.]